MKNKVLFVCLGNICRSPVAEGILLSLNKKLQLNWEIDSAGTAGYHIGEAPDKRTIRNASKNGIDLSPLRARQFKVSDFELFDHIFAMDLNNYRLLMDLAKNESQKSKIKLLMEYTMQEVGLEVPDPYYGAEQDFENVFQLVKKACEKLVEILNVAP